MSLARRWLAGGVLLAALAGPAAAQVPGEDRFFFVAEESEEERDETAFDGSLTSTSFYYTELGDPGDPYGTGTTPAAPESASPIDRLFTDLRAQLDAKHIRGSKFDVRADLRGRLTTTYRAADTNIVDAEPGTIPYQSGTFYGDELEIREMYLRRDGGEYDWAVGRQFVLELAAVRFDGVKVEKQQSERWRVIGFAGTYPTRGSRDLRDDYPVGDNDPDPDAVDPKRIVPITGGVGAAYRYQRIYGAFGLVAIAPLANDQATGTLEKNRVFLHSNGYWRQSNKLDLFHYAVLDAVGAGGAGVTNLTLGANFQPVETLRAHASVSRVDTETLNVQAQTRLEEPDPNGQPAIQNNIEVARIAQDMARVGLSAAFRNRFEISTSGTLRRRPELAVPTADGTMEIVFPASQAADITISAVDRDSWKDLRIGLSGTRTIGIGDANLYRSRSLIVRADASRAILGGKAEVEGNLTYLNSQDDNIGSTCSVIDPESCYGASRMTSVSLGGLMFYRFKPTWFLVGSATLGRQLLTTTVMAEQTVSQPAVTTASLFLRLAYRF